MSIFAKHIERAYLETWDIMISDHDESTLRHVNESVFRYLFIENLRSKYVPFSIEDEWRRVDLMLINPEQQAAIEFKFYDRRPLNGINEPIRYKGCAGEKNFREFEKSLMILSRLEDLPWYCRDKANVSERYFILVGTKRPKLKAAGDFLWWYYPSDRVDVPTGIAMIPIKQTHKILGEIEVFGWVCSVNSSDQGA